MHTSHSNLDQMSDAASEKKGNSGFCVCLVREKLHARKVDERRLLHNWLRSAFPQLRS